MNHSLNFEDLTTGEHTNVIKGKWFGLKQRDCTKEIVKLEGQIIIIRVEYQDGESFDGSSSGGNLQVCSLFKFERRYQLNSNYEKNTIEAMSPEGPQLYLRQYSLLKKKHNEFLLHLLSRSGSFWW